LDQKINIYKRLDDSQNKILLSIDVDTLTGIYDDQNIVRSKVICIDDQKASYKMSLKIAIGKKNYAAFAKQKGF
jgi:TFIIF-interacting CTD phosphatase-like protein